MSHSFKLPMSLEQKWFVNQSLIYNYENLRNAVCLLYSHSHCATQSVIPTCACVYICHALSHDFESYKRIDAEPNVEYIHTLNCTKNEQQSSKNTHRYHYRTMYFPTSKSDPTFYLIYTARARLDIYKMSNSAASYYNIHFATGCRVHD